MYFSSLQKSDLVNFPSLIACTLWLKGCNFTCPYCHNPSLVGSKNQDDGVVTQAEFFEFAEKRKTFLEGVVISGGEPTLYSELPQFLGDIRNKTALKIKLDTNLSNSRMLDILINCNLVDYIAGDFKLPFSKYDKLSKTSDSVMEISNSLKLLDSSDIEFELRTTCVKELLEEKDFVLMKNEIQDHMQKRKIKWYLQEFSNKITLSPDFSKANSFTHLELEELAGALTDDKIEVIVR